MFIKCNFPFLWGTELTRARQRVKVFAEEAGTTSTWTEQHRLRVGTVWGSLEHMLHLPWVQVHSSKINFKFLVRLPFLCWLHAQYHNWDSNISVNTRITWELSKKEAHALALFYESRPLCSWLAFQVIQKIFNICEPLCIDDKLQQPWLKLTFWHQALLE